MKKENLRKELKQLIKEWIIIRHIDFNIHNNQFNYEKWEKLKLVERRYDLEDRVRDIDETIYYIIKYGKENNISALCRFITAFKEEKEVFIKTYESIMNFMQSVFEWSDEFQELIRDIRKELKEELDLS